MDAKQELLDAAKRALIVKGALKRSYDLGYDKGYEHAQIIFLRNLNSPN